MDEKQFKLVYRPASCTQPPWANLIPSDQRDEVLATIRRETIQAYGFSMDECPKRMVCFTKECLGRPLPFKSPTAKPYLDKLAQNQTVVNEEMKLSNCSTCPLAAKCKSTCAQVNDFMNRDKAQEPELVFRDNLDNIVQEPHDNNIVERILGNDFKIPWDAISNTRKQIIKKYLYEQKDFLTIAKELKLTDQSRARYEFYAGLTILSEYGTVRKFLEEKGDLLTHKQRCTLIMVYQNNFKLKQVAYVEEISKQSVQQIISRVLKKYNIRWHIFVKKHKNKVIYNVPELLK